MSSTSQRTSRFSFPNTEAFSRLAHQFTQRVDKNTHLPISSKPLANSSKTNTSSKNTTVARVEVDILPAVPETQKMPAHELTMRFAQPSPTPQLYQLPPTRYGSNSGIASPSKAAMEIASFSSISPLSTVENRPTQRDLRSSSRNTAATKIRPGLTVDIPSEQAIEKKKALQNSPPCTGYEANHAKSASVGSCIVSPPSTSHAYMARDSIVSPLSGQQYQPMQSFIPNMDAYIDTEIANPILGSPDLSNGVSSSDEFRDDASSLYSTQSSVTSAEADPSKSQKSANTRSHISNAESSSASAPDAAILDLTKSADGATSGHRVQASANPSRPIRNYTHHPPIAIDEEFIPTCALRPFRNVTNRSRRPPLIDQLSPRTRPTEEMGSFTQTRNRPVTLPLSIPTSPTWSQAENELEQQLTVSVDDNPFKWDDVVDMDDMESLDDILPMDDIAPADLFRISRDAPLSPQGMGRKDSVTYVMPPVIPAKSTRRGTLSSYENFRLSSVPGNHIASQMRRGAPKNSKDLSITLPADKRMTGDDFILSPLPISLQEWKVNREITPEVAEGVILKIFQSLESLDDLFACAVINRGFYRVFKRNELNLMKTVLRKMSPPAWEYREICYPGHDDLEEKDLPRQEYTAVSYIQSFTEDMHQLCWVKMMIKEKCQSFLRPEISRAIDSEDPVEAARVDDALWRIWTFCKIFGSRKGREGDVTAQMDWLQGGILVHQNVCTSSAPMWDDMNETIASAPECFAKGNEGGLSAEQVFDIMELWTCLGVLLQNIEGRAIQARSYGIFDKTDVRGGDVDGEEMMLDEWYYWLLAQGLSTVLDLAGPCQKSDASVFHVASRLNLDDWDPPAPGGTRRNFLKEAASRVYEDLIAQVYAESSTKEVQRAISKQRIQRHINEIRTRKNSGEGFSEPQMGQDRSMSEWEDAPSDLTLPRRPHQRNSINNLVTHIPSLTSIRHVSAASNAAQEIAVSLSQTPSPPHSPARRKVAMPLLPSPPLSSVPSNRDRSPMLPVAVPVFDMSHPALRRQEPVSHMPSLAEHPAYAHQTYNEQRHSRENDQMASGRSSSESTSSSSAWQQHPLQKSLEDPNRADNSADRAVHRIVEMGFTPEQARVALRVTDGGDGLRVDRAVELLLRGV